MNVKLHYIKNPILIEDLDIDRILTFNKVSVGIKGYKYPKYFIGYKDDDYKINSLCIILPKMNKYVKGFDKTK